MMILEYQPSGVRRISGGAVALWFSYGALISVAAGWISLIWIWESRYGLGTICVVGTLAGPLFALVGFVAAIINLFAGIGSRGRNLMALGICISSMISFCGEAFYFLKNLPNC